MAELPSGTVTFLFTDLEGSTRLWEQHPEAMKGALARHDEILRHAVARHGGFLVKATEQQLVERLRTDLGDDALGSASTRGATMSPTELVNYALAVIDNLLIDRVDA
jgi:class 3 adenylate cyclase